MNKIGKLMVVALALWAGAASAATGKSAAFPLDLIEGDRVSAGTEELTFSNLWDGDAEATVTIAQDGAAIFTGLTGEGVKMWTVDRNGRYVLTHTTYTNGVAGKVETAVFVVEGKEVPVGELTVAWEAGSFMYDNNGKTPGVTAKNGDQVLEKGVDYTVHYEGNTNAGTAKAILTGLPPYVGAVTNEFAIAKRSVELTSGSASKPYDGTALVCHSVTTNGDGFVSGEGVDFAFTGSQTIAGSSKNAFDYTFKPGTLAGNYTITKTEGDLEVTSGEIVNPFDPDDPSKPVTPEVLARANCITNYDGDGHSIEVAAILNPLIAANNPKITYSPLRDGTYEAKNPTFTNVVSTSVWYRIEADNFNPFTTNALLKILPRSITNVNVAAIGDQTYTGSGIEPIPAVTDMRTLIGMSEPTDILTCADYELSYLNNTNVGTAKIVLSGKNNYEGSQTNTFQIVPAIIPLGPDGAIVATGYTNAYDGAAHRVSVSATGLKTQPTVQYKGSLSAEWQSDSPTYTDVCDTQVWWKVSAPNYQSVEGTIGLKITQAALPGGGEEPGGGAVPAGGVSKFDMVAMYDGEGHTIKTNELVAAFKAIIGNDFAVSYAMGESGGQGLSALPPTDASAWMTVAPDFTNVCETSVWYKVTSANYQDFVQEAKVTVTNRPVTVTSGTKLDFVYDGKPHAFTNLTVTAGSFVAGEGIATSNWATVTRVDEGEVENTFDYAAQEGTDFANYEVSVVTGKIAVVAAPIPVGPGGVVTAVGYTNVYDGAAHGVAVSASGLLTTPMVQYRADEADVWADVSPTFGDVCDTQVWYRVSAPNYAPVVGSVGVRITPRPITLTSKSDTKVYDGTPLTAHEVAVGGDGFADGEGAVVTYSGSQTTVGVSENTFTYTFNDGTKAGNYDITTVNGTLTVTKASIGGGEGGGGEPGEGVVPDGGLSKFDATAMYDGEGHTVKTNELVAAFSEAMIGENTVKYAADDGSAGIGGRGAPALPWLVEAPVYTNAGEYVVWYRVTNPNYEDFAHAAKVTITNRPVTVTVTGHTATFDYDTTEKSVAGCEASTADELYDIEADTAFRGGRGAAALQGVVVFDGVTATRTDVGTTAMGLTAADFANQNANFLVTYAVTDGWVKVDPRVIGDDPSNWDIRLARNPMYDGTEQSAPITQVAFVKPDGNLDDIPYALSGNTATDAGNYVVRISGTGNYTGTVEKDWAITPRNVTLTSVGAEWVYDGTAHSETAVTIGGDGFAAGEGATFSGFPVVRHVSDAATPTANAFTYTLNANTKAQNYEVTTRFGTVKMTPRAVTLTAPTKEKPYDGTPLTFGAEEVEAVATGATLPGGGQGLPALPEGEAFTLGDFAHITEAGRVDATFTVADGTALMADYALTIVPGTLTVTRNATQITVTAKSGSWTYDGQPHTLHEYEATNLGTLIAGDALEVTFDEASVVTTPLDGPEGNGVVANVITGVRVLRGGTEDVTANYTIAPYNGTLTVTKRPVTLKSKSASKTYDGEPLTAHEVEIGGDGFVGEDGAAFTFTGSQTVVGKSRNTFAYALKGGTNAAFYDITKMEGELEVTAADISAGDDSDWQIVMGPSLTYTGLEQIQTLSSVTYKGLPLDYAVVGNAQTDAGNYTMTLTGQGNFTGMRDVAWAIAPKALSLAAGSGSRVYDGTAFTVGTVTAVGFAPGEGAEYECVGLQVGVGSSQNNVATINWNANTKGSNYAVTKLPGTLTVTPRPVTLTAANISKPYDGTPLALTAGDITIALTGGASGGHGVTALPEGESFVFSDFASRTEAGQTPATFSYAAGPGTKLGNYAVTVTPGAMITITKSATAISVTAASGSWAYDGEPHSNRTWTAANLDTLQAGDALEVAFDDASVVTTPQDGANGDGVVPNVITGVRVIRSGAEDVTANYTVEWFPGTLTVTKRPVTVDVKGRTETFTYDGNEKRVEGYEVATEDELYDISADTVFSGTAEATRTDAGTTAMGLVATDFTNNNDCFEVSYAVTDGWVKIEPLDIAAAGDDFAIALGVNPKYNGTVQSIPVESVVCRGLPVTFTRTGENATHAGTYTLTVKANGNFTGERSTTWRMLRRQVTLTSGSATKPYDGSPVRCGDVHIAGDGFIGLEGATFDVRGSQTVAGSSKNAFSYTLKAGTLSGDYDIVKVEGDLTVTKATYPGQEPGGAGIAWSVAPGAATWMYDGRPHGVALTGVPAGVTARLAGHEATDAGDYVATVALDYDAANYEPPTAPAPFAWSIARRPVTLVSDGAEKVYDGTPLRCDAVRVKDGSLGFVDGEGFAATCSGALTDVGAMENLFDYVLTGGALAGNYTITKEYGWLRVTPARAWSDGDEPGEGAVPAGGLSKFDATFAYDGRPHTIDTNALAAVEKVGCTPTVSYALTQEGPWQAEAFVFTDVVATSFWYRISLNNANYEDYVHAARLTITPRDIALVTVAPIADQDFAGAAVEPVPVVTDGEPSIVTADDYTVSYADNAAPGTATLTLTGRGNYAGTKVVTFVILTAARDVVFDALGGRIGSAVAVTQSMTRVYGDLPTATRDGYLLTGWFLGVTNGAPQATAGASLLVDADHTLFAKWTVDSSVSPVVDANGDMIFKWEATGAETAKVVGFKDPNQRIANVVIPDKIEGRFITAIGDGAFANSASGMAALTLPLFCTEIGDRAFYNVRSLTSITFTDVRKWDAPGTPATLSIGSYAFSSCFGLRELTIGESVGRIDDYAFLSCRKLAKIMILGRPSVGRQVFRSAGMDATPHGVEVLIDPALASDTDYMAALKGGISSVTVKDDPIISSLKTQSVSLEPGRVTMTLSVRKASSWGAVDPASVKVRYWASLSEPAETLSPTAATDNGDGTITVEIAIPEGNSGFLQAVME